MNDFLRQIKLLPSDIRSFLLSALFLGCGQSFFSVLMNLRLSSLGYGGHEIGLIQTAGGMGILLMTIPITLLMARFPLKTLLLSATVGVATSLMILGLSANLGILMAAGLCMGAMGSVRSIISGPWFMSRAAGPDRLRLFGWFAALEVAASVIGVLLAGNIAEHLPGTTSARLGWTMSGGALICLLGALPLLAIESPPPQRASLPSWQDLLLPERPGHFVRTLLPGMLISLGAGISIPYFNLYLQQRFHFGPDRIGNAFAAANAAMFIGMLWGPSLGRRFGLLRTVTTSQFLSIPFMLLLAFTHLPAVAFACLMFRTALMNLGLPLGKNFQLECVRPEEHASLNAINTIGGFVFWMIGSWMGGLLIDELGFTISISITAGIYFISTILYQLFWRETIRREAGLQS